MSTFAKVPSGAAGQVLAPLEVPLAQWEALATAPLEANGFLDPGFVLAADRFAQHGGAARVLTGMAAGRLVALLPVTSMMRAYGLPVPALVATQPYNSLTTPLLDAADPLLAAGTLLDGAAAAGARLLVLSMAALEGPAFEALAAAAAARGLQLSTHGGYQRAALATELDAETYLRSGLGAKKLKDLRRLRHRMDEEGAVLFRTLRRPDEVAAGLERFLELEAEGWKGRRGTGLGQNVGDARFARRMAADLSRRGAFEVSELMLGGRLIASGLVIRQADRAQFFKIAYDEQLARLSVGVQLTLEMTRAFIADPSLRFVDSTASAGHPMIDHLWRERLSVGDIHITTRRGDALGPLISDLVGLRHKARGAVKKAYHLIRNRLETTP